MINTERYRVLLFVFAAKIAYIIDSVCIQFVLSLSFRSSG